MRGLVSVWKMYMGGYNMNNISGSGWILTYHSDGSSSLWAEDSNGVWHCTCNVSASQATLMRLVAARGLDVEWPA